MATYYVRNDGSDANTGLGPGRLQAWQTIQKALGAAGISSGDTVYIAPGRYNEFITVNMSSATVQTNILGDPTVSQFSDLTPGVVRIVGTVSDTNQGLSTNTLLTATSKNFLTFRNLRFEGHSCFSATTCTNWTFNKCQLFGRNTVGIISSPNNTSLSFTFTDNICVGGTSANAAQLTVQLSGTTAIEHNTVIASNISFGGPQNNSTNNTFYNMTGYTGGNTLFYNNTCVLHYRAFSTTGLTDTTLPIRAYNNIFTFGREQQLYGNVTAFYASYNTTSHCGTGAYTGTTSGVGNRDNALMVGFGAERFFGIGSNDFLALLPNSPDISAGDPLSGSVGITAGSTEIPFGGNTYIVGDKITFTTTLGNITANQTYTVATVTGSTSFTCTGLTPSTAGTIRHKRVMDTVDIYGVAYPSANAPTLGAVNRIDLSTIGQYIPTEKQVTTYRTTPGSQSQTTYVFLGVTGISFNTPNLVCYYVRNNSATVTVPLVTQTSTGAWVSGGFCEVDSVKLPGLYRFDIPNAMIATGTTSASFAIKGASGSNGAYVTVEFDQASMLISTPGYKLISDQLGANGELDIVQGTQTTVKLQIVDTYNTAVPVGAATCTVEAYSAGNLISTYTPTVQYDANGEMTFVLDSVVTANPAEYKLYVRRNNGGSDTTIHGPMIVRVKRK
jgi:hypothetical protein